MKQKDLIILLVPMFIITILWVLFNIYHNFVSSTITDPLSVQIIPLDGKFNKASLEKIKDRTRIEPLFSAPLENTDETPALITPSISPSPTIQITPAASSSANNNSEL